MRKIFLLLLTLISLRGFSQTSTYSYTGSIQYYTVGGYSSITVDVQGAKGGGVDCYSSYQTHGGCGGRVQAIVAVTPGHVLAITVGGQGAYTSGTGGYGGGGTDLVWSSAWPGGGGGGATTITDVTTSSELIVAGGGGGGGGGWCPTGGYGLGIGDAGGAGGGTTGVAGNCDVCGYFLGGGGGTPTTGGAAGSCSGSTGSAGSAGTGANESTLGAGGGGGGWYGGGSGGYGAGGGGGSSYTIPTIATGVTHTQGYNCGNGTAIITVNCSAAGINSSGSLSLCPGGTVTLTDTSGGGSGTWSSSSTSVATVGSSTGLVTGISAGTATITYLVTIYCGTVFATATITVNPFPTISGSSVVCVGATTTLSATPSGGIWASSTTGTATIGSSSGVVTGVAAGTVTMTYTSPAGCQSTKTLTVNPLPAGITGPDSECIGYTVVVADATGGGTWSSSTTGVATIGTSGAVSALSTGVTTITYSLPTGCYSSHGFTVNPLPSGITGFNYVCAGQTTLLFDFGSGTWSSSNPGIATVGSSSGVVSGISSGTATITYTLPTGCYATILMNVLAQPGAITGDPIICDGSLDTLADTSAGGMWTSSNLSVAYIGSSGIAYGASSGIATITYTMTGSISCYTTLVVTVDPAPIGITGIPDVCVGQSTTLFDLGGGTWSSGTTGIATIGSTSGILSGISPGYSTINYTLPTGCFTSLIATVSPLPSAITGTMTVCVGLTTTLSDTSGGGTGTWSSGTTSVAVVSSSGVVTGVSGGTAVITYAMPFSGCYTTAIVTVNSSPSPIVGVLQVCLGATTPLSDPTIGIGSTWSISPTTTATVTSGGVVTGVTAGFATVTYSIGAGCAATAVVTVNPLPTTIGGPSQVCVGSTITLTSSAGVTWSSSTTGIATIGSSSGVVTGLSPGVVTITATFAGTGCSRSKTVTVNPLPPAITGITTVCAGSTTLLSDASGTGTWTSTPIFIATIGATSGIVTGITTGVATIDYTLTATGCTISTLVNVVSLPTSFTVTGGGGYCAGGLGIFVGLSGSSPGVTYKLYYAGAPTGTSLTGTGLALDFGLQTSAGTYTVVATNSVTGCNATMTGSATVTINPTPTPIIGATALCAGATITVSSAPLGGIWTSSALGVATIGASSGIITGVHTGTTTIVYTLGTCIASETVTVSPSPAAISGPGIACTGASTTTLTDAISGGLWTSSTPVVATIGSSSGIVTGGTLTGTTTITYSLGSGCIVSRIITVDASPAAITGTLNLCIGATFLLSDVTSGGVWSSVAPAIGSVSTTGLVSGISAGTTAILYTIPSGCNSTAIVTVNPLPGPIAGNPQACAGSFTSLSDGITGGSWTSATTSVATINTLTGFVSGILPGTSVITYALSTGCAVTKIVTVDPPPAVITGTAHVCVGLSTTLADATPGGTWSHTTPAVASLAGSTLIGLAGGLDTVSYTLSATGCVASQVVTVNPVPAAISGPAGVCVGQTIILTDAISGGIWSSGNPAVATIGSLSGMVTGVVFGAASITYSVGGCYTTGLVNVIASPAAITGPDTVCAGQTIPLSDISSGGRWGSSIPSEASVGSSSGIVTGISSGTVIISYTLGTGCTAAKAVVVNPIAPITGTPSVCVGQTTTLADSTYSGLWVSGSSTIATVGAHSGVVSGVASGTSVITYSRAGCTMTETVTVNNIPSPIAGLSIVCAGQSITETDTTHGGTWSSGTPAIATISSTGIVTGMAGGIATISYTLATTGCPAIKTITVNVAPGVITGPSQICIGGAVTYTDVPPGGTWASSAIGIASIGSITGVLTGVSTGTTIISYTLPMVSGGCGVAMPVTVNAAVPPLTGPVNYCTGTMIALSSSIPGGYWSSSAPAVVAPSLLCVGAGASLITYSLGAGCTTSTIVTVNNIPAAITGSTNICQGVTTLLSDATSSGVWSSSAPAVAAIGSLTGALTGMSGGTATITYATVGVGCIATTVVNVSPAPAAITGTPAVCIGATTALGDITPGGTWSSTNPAVGSVSVSGAVTGIAVGTTTISYTFASTTGCAATQVVTVNTLPGAISGATSLCQGAATTLTDPSTGGTWTSGDPAIATVTPSGGVVTGVVTGVTTPVPVTITFGLGAGCTTSATLTVNPIPTAISGPNTVCATQSITLADATTGGAWSSSAPATGSVNATGYVTGITPGVTTISYSNSYSCAVSMPVTVNAMPGPISGAANFCIGGTGLLTDAVGGGTWSSTNTSVVTIGASTGIVNGIALGTATIIYQLPPSGSCFVMEVVNVYPLPTKYTVTGGGNYCTGDTGVHIGLSGSAAGVDYLLYRGATAVGTFAGTGTALDFGLQTVGGTYTATGTSTATGCSVTMLGSVSVTAIPTVTPAVRVNMTPGDTVCAGTTVTFSTLLTNGGTAPTYLWSINGTPVAVTPGYTYIPANGDTVEATVSSNVMCASPATVSSAKVMDVQPFEHPSVSLEAVPGDTVCQGTAVSVRAEPAYGGASPSYSWIKNGAPVSSGTSGVYIWVPHNSDVIYCIMNSNYACRLSAVADTSSVLAINVDTAAEPEVSIAANPGTAVGPGQSDTLTAIVTNAIAPTYQWYINGIPVSGATTNTLVSSSFANNDSVSCSVTSNGTCQITSHQWVYIVVTTAGVPQIIAGSEIQVLPNPNSGDFVIRGTLGTSNDEEVSLEITDMLGQQVYSSKVIAKGGKLDEKIALGGVANGMYMLTLRADADSKVFHVVVEQ